MVVLRDFAPIVAPIRRPDFENFAWLSFPLTLCLVFLFTLGLRFFSKVGTYREGLYFGLYFGALAGILVNFNQYVLYPVPGYVQATWLGFGLAEFVV